MIESDNKGFLYSDIIDKHFISLVNKGIDVTEYLQSNIAYHKVEHKDFPANHESN